MATTKHTLRVIRTERSATGGSRVTFRCTCPDYGSENDQTAAATEQAARVQAAGHIRRHAALAGGANPINL